ncbi:MAG: hypothetical protein NW224_12035 [Leptolyngbyaceae cyanobacterium bins.302]|nr:hypothetical protein [Leptolyngbyaceae cyanobacterium bins.302]
MPNPRITFRVTPELLEKLPADAEERSQFVINAIQAKINPPAPEGEMGEMLTRLEILEAIAQEFIKERDAKPKRSKREATPLDEAIKTVLLQIRPAERHQAKKLFNRLQEHLSPTA